MEIKGRVVLITGGAVRVGGVISRTLAERGAKVVVHYFNSQEAAKKLVTAIRNFGGEAIAVRADVSKSGDVKRMVDESQKVFGRIDILINNAAVFYRTPFPDISDSDWRHFLDVNLSGAFYCAREVAKLMLQQRSGKIINIADVSGINPWPGYIPYSVAKGGLITLTKALAKALAPHIMVNCIVPGPVLLSDCSTEEEKQQMVASTLLQRIGSPQDIANTVAFLIEGSDFITGAIIPVDGGKLIR